VRSKYDWAGFENIALVGMRRDISAPSSVERVDLPDSTILVDYMLAKNGRLNFVADHAGVFPEGE